jgi:hypothetical protein
VGNTDIDQDAQIIFLHPVKTSPAGYASGQGLSSPRPLSRPRIFPFLDLFTRMVERHPVPVAIIKTAVLTPEREIDTFSADRTAIVYGILGLPKKAPE